MVMTFPDELRAWLIRHKLSNYAAAPILGVHEATIGKWLHGKCRPHPLTEAHVRQTMAKFSRRHWADGA